ncbi:MAG: hypothetical protein IJ641_09135 [Lachnospiraceae bacterium]|nr:hypothetical protein [Lachnospiraceae bacterium]
MKRIILLAAIMTILYAVPAYAKPEYNEETKHLMREAGIQVDELEWEEIYRRQQEYQKRRQNSTSYNDELLIRSNGLNSGSVAATDTVEDLHIYSNEYASQSRNYGAKYSYDEFHTAPVDIPANDGYGAGGFDELHINENYRQNVWHPEHRGGRIQGFDEFRYPDEM